MSDSIIVRVTLGSYDVVHPSEQQTQVYVQVPEVARASWLLDASFYGLLKNEPWPHVVDEAHNDYMRRGVVSDSASTAARQAIVDWLLLSEGADYDERYDAVYAAWEADQARQHPVARKLLEQNKRLTEQRDNWKASFEAERQSRNEELGQHNEEFRAVRVAADGWKARVAELEAEPLAWAEKLDAKSLENFLIALSTAIEHEPMDEAIGRIHELIQSYREADRITRRIVPVQALRESEPAALRAEDTADILTLADAQSADAQYNAVFQTIELELTATPDQWAAWQKLLMVDLARTTNRGSCVTSHATWRGIHVVIRCWLVKPETGGDA
jgi:hypothetical protein